MRIKLLYPVWKAPTKIFCAAALIALVISVPVYAQHTILDGHFNGGGGIRAGTGHRVVDTVGQIAGTAETSGSSNSVTSGFWFQAWVNSTIEVAITSFNCAYRDDAVHIVWNLIADNDFEGIHILRAEAGEDPVRITKEPLTASIREFVDYTALPGRSYNYQLEILEFEGKTTLSAIVSTTLPYRVLTLYQNYPNPFNPSTTISFYIPENSFIKLDIYNVKGERIKTLANRRFEAGTQKIVWNGTNTGGGHVSTGIYFYRLSAGKSTLTRKLALMK